ncbi:MAG TPA: hypothetical protein VFJ53_09040 [Solirubrobacterales bacterium]|nr:hypothetical protein [Solirubrobacterales bacterium]
MPSQQSKAQRGPDDSLADDETRLRQKLSANLAEGVALSEFASTLPGRESMSDSEVLQAFRAAQEERGDED